MKNFAFLTKLSRRVASFRRDQKGVSAVEFAMVLPLMVTLYLGVVEVSQGVAIQRKVTLTARTVADLASQVTGINNSDMTNMLTAASAVVAPFPPGELKVTVSAVSIDANGVARVAWSDSLHGTARAVEFDRDAAGRAQCRELAIDLERGELQLRADHRPHDHRRAQPVRPDLHAPAALRHGQPHDVTRPPRPRIQRSIRFAAICSRQRWMTRRSRVGVKTCTAGSARRRLDERSRRRYGPEIGRPLMAARTSRLPAARRAGSSAITRYIMCSLSGCSRPFSSSRP